MGFQDCIRSIVRTPCTLRLVTLSLLSLSDLDVAFTYMFVMNLYSWGGLYHYFLYVVLFFELIYAAAVLWFGPQQKYKTIKMLKKKMENPKNMINSHKVPVKGLTWDSKLSPNGDDYPVRTFKSLEKGSETSDEDLRACEEGCRRWDIQHVWTVIAARNAKNCCERKHGIPGFRLARYGFFAEPTPRDLGGLLNANAAYSFCIGIWQIAIGLAGLMQFGFDDYYAVMPFAVSCLSMVLSLFNVLFNFSEILDELNKETQKIREIVDEQDQELELERDRITKEKHDAVEEIAARYKNVKNDHQMLLRRQEEIKREEHAYTTKLRDLNQQARNHLLINLVSYQELLRHTRQILQGKVPSDVEGPNDVEVFDQIVRDKQQKSLVNNMNKKFDQEFNDEVEKIAEKGLDAAHLKKELDEKYDELEEKKKVVNDLKRKLQGGAPEPQPGDPTRMGPTRIATPQQQAHATPVGGNCV